MDQTSIYLDPKLTRTFAERGSRRVEAVTAGQEKTRISVALTASAAADKAPCLVLIPRKKPLKDFVCPANIVIVYGTKGNFNSQVMVKKQFWIHILLGNALTSFICCLTKLHAI